MGYYIAKEKISIKKILGSSAFINKRLFGSVYFVLNTVRQSESPQSDCKNV